MKEIIPVVGTKTVVITVCRDDLTIRGERALDITASGDDFTFTESGEEMLFESNGRLDLRIPSQLNVTIVAAHQDMIVRYVDGEISINEANQDVMLRTTGAVNLGKVGQDVSAQNINGRFSIESVGGDLALRNIMSATITDAKGDLMLRNADGDVLIEKIGGDAQVHTVSGSLAVQSCGRDVNLTNLGGITAVVDVAGDIRLNGSLFEGEHTFVAENDIIVRWPDGAAIAVTATAPTIENRLELQNVIEKDNTLTGQRINGDTRVMLTSANMISLKSTHLHDAQWRTDNGTSGTIDFDFEFADLKDRISKEINTRLESLGPDIASKLERRVTDAMSKAEAMAGKAQKKADKAMKQAQQQQRSASYGGARPTKPKAPLTPKPPTPPQPPASSDKSGERLQVLKMLQEGLISADEAATLLNALK